MYQIVSLYIAFYQSRECLIHYYSCFPLIDCFHHRSTNACKNTVKVKAAFFASLFDPPPGSHECNLERIRFPHRHSEARIITLLDPAVVNLVTKTHETDETQSISFAAASRAVLPVYERDGFNRMPPSSMNCLPSSDSAKSSASAPS